MKKFLLASAGLALLFANNANAAGYQLNEYSTTGLGRSFAGAGVVGDDYSALAYNPAGMTLNKRSGMQLGVTDIQVYSDVKGEGAKAGEKTKMNYFVTLPSAFGQWNVNDRLFLGAGYYIPFGLSTKHKSGSFVGDAARKSELEVMDTALAAAYKITNKLSLGVTAIYRYIHGNMTANTPAAYGGSGTMAMGYDLDGWTITGAIGAMYEFTPDTRLGISYKLKSKQTVKGDFFMETIAGVKGADDGRASPDLPESVLISLYHKANEKWGLSTSARWTHWDFDTFVMTSPSTPGSTVAQHYNWRSTWALSAGADYYINDNWTWRFGTAYDQSPTRSKEYRTNRIPDVNRIWLSTGASYSKDNWQVDAGIAHLFMQKGHVDNSLNRAQVPAEYSSHSDMFSLNFQYKF